MERLKDLQIRLESDKRRLETGTSKEKVEAAGDLALVETRLTDLKEKIDDAERSSEGSWENFKVELEEDVGAVEDAVAHWIEKYGGI
jgi:hypothetical protein